MLLLPVLFIFLDVIKRPTSQNRVPSKSCGPRGFVMPPSKWVKTHWPTYDNLMAIYVVTCVILFAAMGLLRMFIYEDNSPSAHNTVVQGHHCVTGHYYLFLPFMTIAIAFILYVLAFTMFQTITVKIKGQWAHERMVVENKKVCFLLFNICQGTS